MWRDRESVYVERLRECVYVERETEEGQEWLGCGLG